MAFTTSGQETEWAYSYSPGAHTGLQLETLHGYAGLHLGTTDRGSALERL